jgi:penicillin-binding protein 1A
MEQPEGLTQITAHDPGGKSTGKELVYKETIPEPPENEFIPPTPAPLSPPPPTGGAPVQDAKPKPVEKKPN